MRIPLIAGNWKMYKTSAEAAAFAEEFKKLYHDTDVRAAICAPYTQLETLVKAFAGTGIGVGAQNVYFEKEGAFTGEVSVDMLKEIGVDYCIVGHSERRQYFNETDQSVNRKLKALLETEICPILCVGEVLEEREAGREAEIVSGQVRAALEGIPANKVEKMVIAYEPVWAIGSGKAATPADAQEVCRLIREKVAKIFTPEIARQIRILYGGSVNEKNAAEFNISGIDGVLVGGASLDAERFAAIVRSF